MKVLKSTFEQIYSTGIQYLNQRLGGEVLLEDGETMQDGWRKMKKDAEDYHKEQFPHLHNKYAPLLTSDISISQPIPEVQVENPKDSVSLTIEQINQASDITVLESFRLLSTRNEQIKEAYNKRLEQLQNQTTND
jgi:hypothetical protein